MRVLYHMPDSQAWRKQAEGSISCQSAHSHRSEMAMATITETAAEARFQSPSSCDILVCVSYVTVQSSAFLRIALASSRVQRPDWTARSTPVWSRGSSARRYCAVIMASQYGMPFGSVAD